MVTSLVKRGKAKRGRKGDVDLLQGRNLFPLQEEKREKGR